MADPFAATEAALQQFSEHQSVRKQKSVRSMSEQQYVDDDDDDSTGSTGSDSSGDWTYYSSSDDEDEEDAQTNYSGWDEKHMPTELVESDNQLMLAESLVHNSSPAIAAMHTNLIKKSIRDQVNRSEALMSSSAPHLTGGMPKSLLDRINKADSIVGKSIEVYEGTTIEKGPPSQRVPAAALASPVKPIAPQVSPQEHFETLIQNEGVPNKIAALTLDGFFVPMTKANVRAYSMEKLAAIRTSNVSALQEMWQRGELLQVCNKFGESIVHTCCRRGEIDCMRFLTEHAMVSVKVIDDYGRTPFHDACWTNRPIFELVDLLMNECPGLLLIADKRGCTPLEYVRKEHWDVWCQYLDINKDRFSRHALFSR